MPGFIWVQQGVDAYKQRYTGEGPTFQERKRSRVSCDDCGGKMADYSLQHHLDRSHGLVLPQVRGVYIGGGGSDIYKVLLPQILKSVECLVKGYPERAKTPGILREHFMYQNWKSRVAIM